MLAWALLLSCAACGPNPTEPGPSAAPRVIPVLTPLLVQDSACTRITFTFVGSKNIEVTFPDRTTCSSGVALIPGGTATRNGSGSRNANIPIRLLNRSGYTLQGPARVVLSPADRVILDPAGGDPNKLTPQNHDSVRAESGAWVWLAGGPGTVAVDDSSAVTTLVVRLASPAGSAQMSFTVDVGQLSPGGWPLLAGLPLLDPTKIVTVPGTSIEYFRTAIMLGFQPGVSNQEKQQFFSRLGLTVIGATSAGPFFVSIPDPGPSLADFEGYLDFLESQPEVAFAGQISRSDEEIVSARFPSDSLPRAAWFSSGNPLWAMRAIRAPQAWGCETGNYAGSSLVHVGLLEPVHSPQHPELAASFFSQWVPPDDTALKMASKLQRSVARRDTLHAHGAETAGLLTASGDDNRGIAGTAWRTQLSMYSLLSNERRLLPYSAFFAVQLNILSQGAPKILSISSGWIDASGVLRRRQRQIDQIEPFLRELMDQAPDLVLVIAAGNEKIHTTPSAYEGSAGGVDVLRAAVLRLRVDPLYSERIIVVAGTEPGNEFWATNANDPTEGSNSFAGATDIGAPAHAVIVMDTLAGGKVGIRPAWGTSLSAPMVAGAAALLLAMDPSLTAADVKRYLIRGSQAARYDSTTGMLVSPVPVKNVPNATFHQLDVYGALSLLSKERQGLPICGYSVSVGTSIGQVFLERDGPTQAPTDSIKVPGAGHFIGRVSVAPGGRILAAKSPIDSGNGGNQSVVFFSHRGERLGHRSFPYRSRNYVEAHYVDHRELSDGQPFQEFTRYTSQGVQNGFIQVLKYPDGTIVRTTSSVLNDVMDVSPDGCFVAFSSAGVTASGTFVQRFSDNATTRVGDMGNVRWTKDGTRLLVFRHDSTGGQVFQFYQVDSTEQGGFNPGQQTTTSGRGLLGRISDFSGDDAVFLSGEFTLVSPFSTFLAVRPLKALATIAAESVTQGNQFRTVGNLIGRIP